jgi:hypothetical protein
MYVELSAIRRARSNLMLRTIRNIALSVVLLIVVFTAAAVGYILLTGNSSDTAKTEPLPAAPTPETSPIKPSKPGPNVPESAGIQSLFSPVKVGANTSMTIKTLPGSTCTITFIYNNIASKDSGLAQKTADDYGIVTWSWTVDSGVPVGTWPAKATCVYNKKSAVVIGNVEVTK